MSSLQRQATTVREALAELDAARDGNDLPRWKRAKQRAELALAQAIRALERAHAHDQDATAETKEKLATLEAQLATNTEHAHAAEAPRGYVAVADEDRLVALVREAATLSSASAFEPKADAIHALVDALSSADVRVLVARIGTRQPHDVLVGEIWKLGAERRQHLFQFIHNVDRRKARERAAERRRSAQPPPPAPESETINTRLRRAFDGHAIEHDLLAVVASEDGAVRRALADRFRRYRPGSGDDIAARFHALDAAVKARVLAELGKELQDAVHDCGAAFLAQPESMLAVTKTEVTPDARDPMRPFRETRIDTATQPADGAAVASEHATRVYLGIHERDVWAYLRSTIGHATWGRLSERVSIDEPGFAASLVAALHDLVLDFEPGALRELVDDEVLAAVAPYVPTQGTDRWAPAVATVIGHHVLRALVASVQRVVPRFIAATDALPDARAIELADRIPLSRPLDAVVSRSLAPHLVVGVDARVLAGARKPTAAALVRPVTLIWQGARDPELWNVVRAEPADATAEEVVAVLARTHHAWAGHASELAVAAPLFALPIAWALEIPAAREHAPKTRSSTVKDSVESRVAELATSSYADELARSQAGHASPIARPEAERATEEALILLDSLRALFTPWELANEIITELTWTAAKRDELQHAAEQWMPIAVAQRDRLVRIASLARAIDRAASGSNVSKRAHELAPFREVLRLLARAAATSHLAVTSQAALDAAIGAQAKLRVDAFAGTMASLDATMGEARDRLDHEGVRGPKDENDVPIRDVQSRKAWVPYTELRARAERIEQRLEAGEDVDPVELERVELEMQETTLRTRLHALQLTLDQLSGERIKAAEGLVSHVVATSRFRSLGDALDTLHASIGEIYIDLNAEGRVASDDLASRKAALAHAQERFASLDQEKHLGRFLEQASKTITDQATRSLIAKLAVILVASVALAAVANVAGAMLAEEGVGALGVTVASNAIEIVGTSSAQYLASAGERGAASYWTTLAENTFYAVGAHGISGTVTRETRAAAAFEKLLDRQLAELASQEARAALAARRIGGAVRWVGTETLGISAHAIMGMALGATFARARQSIGGPRPAGQTDEDFLLQAATIAIGRFLHASVAIHLPQYAALARLDAPGGRQLEQAARGLEQRARALIDAPDARAALGLLEARARLLEQQLAVLDALEARDTKGGPSVDERTRMRDEIRGELARLRTREMLDLSWRILGLHELESDRWTGTTAELELALSQARETGHAVVVESSTGIVTSARIDGRAVELHAVGDAPSRPGDPPRGVSVRTAYGHVWPGQVPEVAPPAVKQHFEKARQIYESFKQDTFQGGTAGRLHWMKYLVEHGIQVDGATRYGGEHDVYAEPKPISVSRSATAVDAAPEMGLRSGNTGAVTLDQCERAVDELISAAGFLAGAKRRGSSIEIRLTDGRTWRIELAAPRRMADDQMADFAHEAGRDLVWVSDRLTNEQIPRAIGAILGKAINRVGYTSASAELVALDAMFAHRDRASQERPATTGDVKARATADSRLESIARIDAEIELALHRMGISGVDADARIVSLPSALATKVRAQLTHQAHIGVRPEAALRDSDVARPHATPPSGRATSKVLPDAPSHVHAYTEADHGRVLELRAELEIIKEIDTRTALRDQSGTNGGTEIAKGETERRASHVARARELLAELQLGGTDTSYLHARLKELAAVFPGAERDLVPAIETRIQRRDRAAAIHARAEAIRAARVTMAKEIAAQVRSGRPFTTKRAVVGAGPSALADVATLRVAKHGAHVDPAELLVLGGRDLMDRIDPASSWGQRGAVYDRSVLAHPAFSDATGAGTGELLDAIEDPGEFMHVGELRDAMDLAREHLGMVALDANVVSVETFAEKSTSSPDWGASAGQHPVRIKIVLDGEELYVYCERADLTPGPGNPRFPSPKLLSPSDRDAMATSGTLFTGDRLLEGADVQGKHVLVVAFGPTGAWAARAAADRGARVDWAGAAGGELDAGEPEDGNGRKLMNTASNSNSYSATMKIDRTQPAADPAANIHTTFDRIVHIEPHGRGATVTFAHGPAENFELYTVTYDAIITSMGYTTDSIVDADGRMPAWASPSVKNMVGAMRMEPARSTRAPILTDKATGRVRVVGYAAGDAINLDQKDIATLSKRRTRFRTMTSADSPDDRVIEGIGLATRNANERGNP